MSNNRPTNIKQEYNNAQIFSDTLYIIYGKDNGNGEI
jgi:hypothetical protein